MNMRTLGRVAGGVAAVMLAAFGPGGCSNDDPSTGNLDSYFASHPQVSDPRATGNALVTIAPESAVISQVGGAAVFTAAGGQAPYTWDVANGTMGTVSSSGAAQAIYTALAVGNNDVIVYDANKNAAIATISGTAASAAALAVSANPASLAVTGALSVLTATGGQAPYTWSLGNPGLGSFLGTGQTATGASVVYKRGGPTGGSGDNSVTVTDSLGATASVVISQP